MEYTIKSSKEELLARIKEQDEELRKFKESPLASSYLSCLKTIERWNKQLYDKEIDIFNIEDKPKFDMAHKYLTEQKPYIEQLEYLRKLMTPEQQKELAEKVKYENLGLAEKLALKAKNG